MKRLKSAAAAIAVSLAFATSGCSGVTPPTSANTVTFAQVPGFDDTAAVTALWSILLEERGYRVQALSMDLAAGFAGIARGDIDGYLNAWLPSTHEAYISEYREDLVVLDQNGPFFDDNRLVLAVPKTMPENSLEDLSKNPGSFDSKITGIEAGSGLMNAMPKMLETYGLEDTYKVIDASTPAALATLERAARDQTPAIAALWTPHWAFASMDIKALDDPKEGWPAPDGSYVVVSEDFAEKRPEVTEWLSRIKFTAQQYAELMLAVSEGDSPKEGAQQWLSVAENRQLAEQWFK